MNHIHFPTNLFHKKSFILIPGTSKESSGINKQLHNFTRNKQKRSVFGHFLNYILWFSLIIPPIYSFSQVVETETEEEIIISPIGSPIFPKHDSVLLDNPSSQTLISNCSNSNFSLGTFNGWIGSYGNFNNPALHAGFDTNTIPPYPFANFQCYGNPPNQTNCPPLHSLIAAPGTLDPNTGDSLISVFTGEPYSTRLGHTVGGAHSARLRYSVTVTNSTYLFVYRYAVVLQNPNHTAVQQPSFTIEVQNASGQVIDSTCGYYYVYAHLVNNQPLPTWHKHNASGGQVIWKEWTTVGMSLANYVGQTVTIVFTTKDCSPGGHFGYAYLSAYCSYLQLQTAMCEGDTSAILTAPPGFDYLWSNGDTTASITVPHPTTGSTYSCVLTAVNGCTVTITITLTYTVIHTNFTHGTACATQPVQFNDSSWVNQNSVANWQWYFGDASPMVAGVANPTHTYSLPGTYNVKLVSYSTEGCRDSITKSVIVGLLPTVTTSPLKESICSKSSTNITLTSNLPGTLFTWTAVAKGPNTTGFSSNTTNPTTVINQTLINTGAIFDTVTYTITPHNGGCDGNPVDFKVTVKPLPVLTNVIRIKSICSNSATNITLLSNNDSTFFTWVCTASSPNLTGYSNNTTNPVKLINQTIINNGFTIDTVNYHIIPQSYGCFGDTTIFKVVVNPSPNVSNAPMNKSICSNTSTNLTLTSNVTGTTFTWTCTPSSGNVTGYANGSGAFIGQVLNNNGFNNETVIYHIIPTANSCAGQNFDYTVTVFPVPNLSNNPLSKQICNNTSTNITLTSNVTGTLFIWNCTPSSGNVTGYSNNLVPTTTLNQTLINSGTAIETVTYHIFPSANGCDGNEKWFIVTVFPVPNVIFTPPTSSLCSGGTTNITLTSSVLNTTFTYTATASSGNLSGYSGGAGNKINQTLTNSGFTTETVTYHITPAANGCSGSVTDYVVTVYPIPNLSNSPLAKQICSNTNTNITLTSNVTGTLFTWICTPSSGNVTGWSNNAVPTNLLDQTLINTGNAIETVTYKITPMANGCTASLVNYVVTVYPVPNLSNNPKAKQICNNTSTNITLTSNISGTLFTWTATGSSPQVSGYSDNSFPTTSLNQTLVNSGYNIETVTYHITPHANGCDGTVTDYVVTVYPVPNLSNTPLNKSQCNNLGTNITLTSNVSGTLFTWTCTASSGNIIGWSNNAVPTTTLNQILNNTGNNIETVTYHITPIANSCSGVVTDFMVSVYPSPTLSNSPLNKQQCSNLPTNITLTSNVVGTLFTWTATGSSFQVSGYTNNNTPSLTINDILVNSGFNIETVTYHITGNANGCNGAVTNYVVTVYPVPNVVFTPPAPSICSGQTTNIALSSGVSGTTFSWTASPSSLTVTGYSAGSGNTIAQTLTTPGITVETVTYTVTPVANTCTGPTFDVTVTINPKPHVTNNPMRDTICSGQTTNTVLTSSCLNTSFTWTASINTGNVSGFSNGSGNQIIQTLTNNISTLGSVKYTIQPMAGPCVGNDTNYIVWVKPTPLLSNSPASKSICSNTPTNVTLTSNVAGTTFTWTATGSSPQVSGYTNNNIPSITINDVLTNSGYNIETVTYHLTPYATGCNGPVADYLVTVYPVADAYFQPPAQTICTGQTSNINILSHVSGTTFSWTTTPSSPLLSGYSNGSGTNISQIIFSSSTVVEILTYHVIPVANGCTGTATDFILTVNPGPALTTTPSAQTICSGLPVTFNLTSNVAGTAFSWVATSSSPNISGFTDGSGNLINQTLTNSGYTIETVTYAITPSANGCTGAPINAVATVNPVPDLSNNPPSQQQCNNQATNLTLTSNVAGTTFTWTCTPSSGNITGWSNSVTPGTIINQTLNNASLFPESVMYHITPHANGCDGPVTDFLITVIFKPALTNSPLNEAICNNTSTNLVLTANVPGTLFTWLASGSSGSVTGYSSNITTPTNIVNQTLTNTSYTDQTVTYRFVPHASGCEGDTTPYVVTVHPTPDLTTTPLNKHQCNNLGTNIGLTSNVAGTLFTWSCTPSSANMTGWNNNNIPSITINDILVNTGFDVETVTYHITPHANNCNGIIYNYVVTVYPTPDLSNTPLNKTQCNNLGTNINLTSNVSGTLFTWTATGSTPQITGYNNNNIPSITINDILDNNGFNIETVTYHITPHANNCNGIVYDYIVTVNPTPNLSNSPLNKSQCNNQQTNLTLTSNVTGTLFTWTATGSSPQVTGYTTNNTPSITINDLLTNSGYNVETVTYHITPHANSCNGLTYDYVVTVYPTPDLSNTPLNKSQCNNLGTNINLTSNVSGTLFTWTAIGSSPQITGYNNNNIPSITINDNLINTGFNIETVTYHITPHANNCNGIVYNYVVTVNPTPNLSNSPLNKSQCNNQSTNINLTSNVTGTLFTWTSTGSSPQVTGYTTNNTPSITINDLLTNSGYNVETVTYHITPHANNCNGIVYNYVVTVYPTPDLSNTPRSKQQCNNQATNITLTSNVAGTLFTWTCTPSSASVTGWNNNNTPSITINDLLTNLGFNIETVTYHITPRANNCNGIIYDYMVTVNPTPNLTNTPLNKSQCNNLATNINLTSNVSGTLFTWTANGSSPQVTGYTTNNTPSITINDLLINSGNNIETVTYHITPHANNCNGIIYDYMVTVYPTTHVSTSPLAQTICTNTAISVNLTSTVIGTTFAWTCSASSPNLGGFSNGAGALISQTLTNSGYTIETVTYHITPTANSCAGPVTDYVVTVNPKPDVSNNPLSAQICSGISPNITLTSNVAGTNFSWTATGSSPNVTGYGLGSGTVINQVLTNTGFAVETVTYHITPTANSCTGNMVDYVVTIVSVPDVYFNPSSQTICSAQTTNIQVLSHVVGATFTYTASASSPNISGYSGGSGALIAQTLTNSGTTIETVTYTVTPSAFGCPSGPPQNVVATVNPKPAITNPVRTSTVCSAQAASIIPQSTVTGSTYLWTASGSSANVSGFSNGTGLSITQTLTNSGFNIETVTYIITPTANSCSGDTSHFQMIVFPVADVYFTPATQAICPLQTCNVTINSHVAGASYTWTASGSSGNVTGFSAGSGNLIQQTLNNGSYNIETVTYHVTPVANGCTGTANNMIVSVDPNPSVNFMSCWDQATTTDAQPIKLKGGTPLNGTYSGTGVNAGSFYPAVAGVGTFTITYSYSNNYGCNGVATSIITVVSPPAFSCGNTLIDVRDNKTYATVQIGTQCWMAANLNYGNTIASSQMQRDNCIPEKYCYNDNTSNCTSNGGLYQWDELMKYDNASTSQGFCPPGWHIPTEANWTTLFNFYISNGFAGSPLKYTGYSGFNAFLTGVRFKNASWNFNNFAILYWSSTMWGSYKAWAHGMNTYNPSVSKYPAARSNALSVRCLKD